MEEDTEPSTSDQPQAAVSQLDDALNALLTAECTQMFPTENVEKIPSDKKAAILLNIIKSSEVSEELRVLSIDRLSDILADNIHTWSSEELAPFCDQLIEIILADSSPEVSHKLTEILAKVTVYSIELNSGVECYTSIISFIKNSVDNPNRSIVQTALALVQRVPTVFGAMRPSDLRNFLQKCLKDGDYEIRLTGLKTLFAVIGKETFSTLSTLLSNICEEFVESNGSHLLDQPFCPIHCLCILINEYPGALRPHFTAVVHLCSVATTETKERTRVTLTILMAMMLTRRTDTDVDEISCSKISRFILNCAPTSCDEAKLAALDVVVAIPTAFGIDCAPSVHNLLCDRLNDENPLVRSFALRALSTLIRAHDRNNGYLRVVAVPLTEKLLELGQAQFETETAYSAIDRITDIAVGRTNLLDKHRPAVLGLTSDILCKVNALKENNCPLSESQSKHRSNAFEILGRVFNSFYFSRATNRESETIILLRQQLTKAVYLETNSDAREEIFRLIASASYVKIALRGGDRSWDEVVRHLTFTTTNDHDMAITLEIIRRADLVGLTSTLLPFFSSSLSHSLESIRSTTVKAFSSHCSRLTSDDSLVTLGSLIPTILKIGKEGGPSEREAVVNCMQWLVTSPLALNNHLSEVFRHFCEIINNTGGNERERRTAFRFFISVCENDELKKQITPDLKLLICTTCVLVMGELEEDPSTWLERDDADGRTHREGLASLGETTLETAVNIPAAFTFQIELNQEDWRKRHAMVMFIGVVGRKMKQLSVCVNNLICLLADPQVRVRAAAATALGRIFSHSTPNLIEQFHGTVIPALLSSLEKASVPRVAATAAAALAKCCKACPKPILAGHCNAIMRTSVENLVKSHQQLLTEGKTRILSKTVALIVCAKDASQFLGYYEDLIGPLKTILTGETHCHILDEAALECLSYVGIAVNNSPWWSIMLNNRKRAFAADAVEIMRSLSARFSSFLLSADKEFVPSFCRIVTAMGDSFHEFIPIVVPIILRIIRESSTDDEGWYWMRKRSSSHSRVSVESSLKLDWRHSHSRTILGAAYSPFLLETCLLALEYLTLAERCDTRVWAIEMFPALLSCVIAQGGRDQAARMWSEYWRAIGHDVHSHEKARNRGIPFMTKLVRSLKQCIELKELSGSAFAIGHEERVTIEEMVKNEEKAIEKSRVEREDRRRRQPEREKFFLEEDEREAKLGENLAALSIALKKCN